MKYRFYGDEMQLVKYELVLSDDNVYDAVSDEEKDELLNRYPEASVEEVDNTGYEWLDGKMFTQEQQRSGEVEKAIEMGQEAYEEYIMNTDPTYQILELDVRVALLEMGITAEDIQQNE